MAPTLYHGAPIDWCVSSCPIAYAHAVEAMDARVNTIIAGAARECVWLLEHPPLYTAGTSARADDLLLPDRFPVHTSGRGGQYTYHGPGQRIAYVMLDLRARGGDVRAFVQGLEDWLVATLARFDIAGERRPGRVGIWVERPSAQGLVREDKIAALGIRVRHGISLHGVSLNVCPDLEHFAGIVPCGIGQHGVTSFADLGVSVDPLAVDNALRAAFDPIFGPTQTCIEASLTLQTKRPGAANAGPGL
jgi:lipoyl(octanoyl) transferase